MCNQTRFLLLAIVILGLSLAELNAQVNKEPIFGWQKQVAVGLNLSQTSFDNWSQGGENTLAWQFNLNSKLESIQKSHSWSNTLKLSYGRSKIGAQEARKTVDEIKLETVYSRKLGIHVNPYVSASLETQIADGFTYTDSTMTKVSDFMDPGYLTQSIGMGYAPAEQLKTRLGFALKETVTRNHPFPYSDNPQTAKIEKVKVEAGLEGVSDFSQKLSQNILLTSRLELFSNLRKTDQTDVRWDTILSAKISKLVDVNFNTKLFYDKDVSKRRQIKQALALGLTYSFL